jgi:serine protease inhibitor
MYLTKTPRNALAVIVPAALILGCSPDVPGAQIQSLVEGNTAFALDLYGQLKAEPGNLFFSPYSISTALAMTYAGARGETEKQMAKVLHFSKDQRVVHTTFSDLQRQLGYAGQQKSIQLSIANALWAQEGDAFLPTFLRIANSDYQANIGQADFKTHAEAARDQINRWAAQATKDKIKDILPPGSLTELTRLVLANAIYFKGAWAEPFEKAATSIQPFHLNATRQVNAPLMHHSTDVRYMENSDLQAVELPYVGGGLSMVVLLPRQVDGCGPLGDRLTPALIADTLRQMKRQEVRIFLPKFKLESSFKLNETLARMGMPDAFVWQQADFSGLDGTKSLFISAVFHKAWCEVNEEGTEAAAGTAAVATRSMPPVFRADHPFIFLIRDTRFGSLLFLGRLADPSR